MKDIAPVSRRTALRLIAAGVGTLVILEKGFADCSNPTSRSPSAPLQALLQRLAGQDCAVIIGAEYLRQVPNEVSLPTLMYSLASLFNGGHDATDAGPDATCASILERHRDDFREGRVLKIHGWTFSRTELRLCAIAYRTRCAAHASAAKIVQV